jgi:hypothetical protein
MSRHTDNQSSSHGNKSGITIIACEEDPQTRDNSKWSFYNSSSLNKKKRQSVKKETCKGSRPPFAKESSAHLAPRTPHTDKRRREELRPFSAALADSRSV